MINTEYKFTKVCEESDDIDMLVLPPMNELINYKWMMYGFNWHMVGSIFHTFYMFVLYIYIQKIYLHDPYSTFHSQELAKEFHKKWTMVLNLGIIYPVLYESWQAYKTGSAYFKVVTNYLDLCYIFCNVTNIILQYNYS